MTDLPIASTSASTSPAPAARRAPARTALRATPASDGTIAAGASLFQDVLAQEFATGPEGQPLTGTGAAETVPRTHAELKADDEPEPAAAAADAAPGFACVSVSIVPPALNPAAALTPALGVAADSQAPRAGASALPPTSAPARTERTAGSFGLRPAPPPAPAASAKSDAEPRTDVQAPAADLAVPGKFAPATGETRRESAFDPSLLERHKPVPAASSAIHAYGAPTSLTHAPSAVLNATVGEPGWNQDLGNQLVWMASQKHQVAELHLNPPDLGPLRITLTLDKDQASAQFVSAHAVVREAIETALPQLREMLADRGITLGDASVSADAFRGQAQQEPQHEPRAAILAQGPLASADPGTVTRGTRALRLSHGLVDTFV